MTPREQLAEVFDALAPGPGGGLSWFGASLPDRFEVGTAPGSSDAEERARANLQACLYDNFYLRGRARPLVGEDFSADARPDFEFVATLAAACTAGERREWGWEVLRVEGGRVWLRRNGLQGVARAGEDCVLAEGAEGARRATVLLPGLLPSASPGFYAAQGVLPIPSDAPCLRVYVNLRSSAAAAFLRAVPPVLEEAAVPFRLKCLNRPRAYHRCDAGVVYLGVDDVALAARLVARLAEVLAPMVKAPVPALTRGVAPGVAVAWDPGAEESFGTSRCRLLAEAVHEVASEGVPTRRSLEASVEAAFAREAIDVDTPWRRRTDPELPDLRPGRRYVGASRRPPPSPPPPAPLSVASAIGEHLLRTALPTEAGGLTWMGAVAGPGGEGVIGADVVYEPIGGDLYGGTAGVASFLTELFRLTGDRRFAEAALGALDTALRFAETLAPPRRVGLYHGGVGVALAAERLGRVLGEPRLTAAAQRLVASLDAADLRAAPVDLLAGLAGGVVGLLVMDAEPARRAGRAAAERLLETRHGTEGPSAASRPLTGFSIGLAGIAYALLVAWERTGDARYRAAALQALEREQALYDPRTGNWPDHRPLSDGSRTDVRPHGLSWCQGAPGVALSRIAAWRATGVDAYRLQAIAALRTTASIVDVWLESGGGNYSLCHGLAGNAQILGIGGALLPEPEARDFASRLERAAILGAREFASTPEGWPTGIGGEGNPSLMLGLSGTGLFYLRLHDAGVPTWLLPGGCP